MVSRGLEGDWGKKKVIEKKQVVPGFEPGLFGSKPKVITTTLYNLLMLCCVEQ